MVKENLDKLRKLMKENNLNMYYIPTDDYHTSEYVGAYFKARAFMSGFTGSAGVLLVTLDSAYLWVDGRYFLQAEAQIKDSTINLMKMGERNVPTVLEFIKNFSGKKSLGFDGRCVSASFGKELETIEAISINPNLDLVNEIWANRPEMSHEAGYELDIKYAGEERISKLEKIRENICAKSADLTVISSLDDIMWTLNLRGNDVTCNPVILSYLLVDDAKAVLYLNESVLNEDIKRKLAKNRVIIRPYDQIYSDVLELKQKKVIIDLTKTNYKMYKNITLNNQIIVERNITTDLKARKNKVEVENFRQAHLKDAVAVCKFMYWLKTNVGKIKMTELSVSEQLLEFRKQNSNFLDISFGTIAGFAEHGAIVHYGPTKETDKEITKDNLLLVDSGAHYLEGTTDITRTFALGNVTSEMKHDFTLVLKGYLALSELKFKKGATGKTLDLAARAALWAEGLDFNHGTGHGVGYVLNVHEGPQGIKYDRDQAAFDEGMITSDEPGLYKTGKYGIRHESLVLCKKYMETEFGTFLCFEPITLVPFDLDGIDVSLLTKDEKDRLNAYHEKVYQKVSPFLDKKEAQFLRKYTKAI